MPKGPFGGLSNGMAGSKSKSGSNSSLSRSPSKGRTSSKTAPARLEGPDDDAEDDNALFKVLAEELVLLALVLF